MPTNPSDAHPPAMRHRAGKDPLGAPGAPGRRGRHGSRAQEAREFEVTLTLLGAARAVGYRISGARDIEAVRSLGDKLDRAIAGSGGTAVGPLMSVLTDDPMAVLPPDRSYLVARAIRGPSPQEEGLERLRLVGGYFLSLPRVGKVEDLEPEYGFVLGSWLEEKRYVLSSPQIREVYVGGLEVDDPRRVPMEILFPITAKLMPDEPGFR